jgi:ATP-dependent Clp protease ATP-binding subunit ClpA
MGFKNALEDVAFMNSLFTTAEREAHQLGDDIPGAEHLLLAALAMEDDSAREAFGSAGIDADALRGAVVAVHDDALRSMGLAAPEILAVGEVNRGAFRSSAVAQEVFHNAVAISKKRRPRQLRTADIARAVAELEGGTAARALSSLGVDRQSLIAAATAAVVAS